MLYGLKGESRLIASLCNEHQRVELLQYHDGSWMIVRNGLVVGCWEACDECDCVHTFVAIGGLPDAVVMLKRVNPLQLN